MRGELALRFSRSARLGRTVCAAEIQRPPLRIVRAFACPDGAALVHLHNIAGGVLAGDRLRTEIAVEAGALAQLTTTGATRVYRSHDGRTASAETLARVAAGGLLEYLPDATIPFAGASYEQRTRVELDDGAGLCWWEILAPGREAAGERFAYRRLGLSFEIWAGERPLALERMELEPARADPADPLRFGPYGYLASCHICQVGLEPGRWLALAERLALVAQELTAPGAAVWGVSPLAAHGLVVRGLASTQRALADQLPAFWRIAKQELRGSPLSIPRKLY